MNRLIRVACCAGGLLLAACHDNKHDDMGTTTPSTATATYRVTLTNITAGQPFSPPVLVLHGTGYHLFEEGKGASVGLEMLAEAGRNSDLAADAVSRGLTVTTDSSGVLLPGKSRSLQLSSSKSAETRLSLASMLGKTNDGFTGADSLDLSNLQVGGRLDLDLPAWDAGTELNSERMETLGALGGEGFNPMRDDRAGVVTIHAGVRSNREDSNSALSELQRFDNPVLHLTIERL